MVPSKLSWNAGRFGFLAIDAWTTHVPQEATPMDEAMPTTTYTTPRDVEVTSGEETTCKSVEKPETHSGLVQLFYNRPITWWIMCDG